jgi:hypothetical protein
MKRNFAIFFLCRQPLEIRRGMSLGALAAESREAVWRSGSRISISQSREPRFRSDPIVGLSTYSTVHPH